ncbi:lytic murein transglycosylase [Patulibacter sp. SYSU D01012]|uniref:lytic murein transglycosylase n=1 Tax=Patulibacter sp. SYSU D01012 TaxID=2817381 RepID=UPI001B303073|nr:lytic murein transglycosylase [Patulibacter sp. SYSU D01012]
MTLSTRKLLVGLSAAGAMAAGFGATVQAGAQARTLEVTLAGGRVLQITVDVPVNTPLDQIPLPDLGGTVIRVREASAPAATTDAAPATPTTTDAAPAAPAPPATTPGATPAAPPAGTTTSTAPTPSAGDEDEDDAKADKAAKRKKAEAARKKREAAAERKARRDRTDGRKVTRTATEQATPATPQGTATTETAPDAGTTPADPLAAAPVGVPNYFIDKFRIPPFLLPIYQAAGIQYGVRWEILAAINEIETDYGRNLNVSSAGALGWMQFMPATWKQYGVDANGDGKADPYNPVDAIFAAARYLKAAGAQDDIRRAIFAYNHADWYVDSVLMRARVVSGLPEDLVGSLTGLTQGLFPVASDEASYAGDDTNRKARTTTATGRNAAKAVESADRREIDVEAPAGSPAVAVQDGTVVGLGENAALGRYVRLRDVYGNTYTYAGLGRLARLHPVAKDEDAAGAASAEDEGDAKDPAPTAAATAGEQPRSGGAPDATAKRAPTPDAQAPRQGPVATDSGDAAAEGRVYANPLRPNVRLQDGDEQPAAEPEDHGSYSSYLATIPGGLTAADVRLETLRKGSRVMAGTVLGRIGRPSGDSDAKPHVRFEIRPAGKGSPRVDPKPILDGWKLLETTAVLRAKDTTPLFRAGEGASAGQILLMSKAQLQARVLADPNLDVYAAGRQQIRAGAVDRRVLATLEYLTANGLRIGVSSLRRPGAITSAGNVSEHDSGNAVDISSVNGITITKETQGPGSITEQTIRLLLGLQGTMKPHQIISLMTFAGADNTMYLPDHADHIHVGFRPSVRGDAELGEQVAQILKPGQWIKLIDRIGDIDNPTVLETPSKYAVRTPKAQDRARTGD